MMLKEDVMNEELAGDLIDFQGINERAYSSTATEAELNAASQKALHISREHLDQLANYFAIHLERTTLSYRHDTIEFHFQDANEAAETFKMCIRQIVEPRRAERTAYLVINSMLRSFGRPSAFKDDSEHVSATLLVAASIDSYRRALANELANAKSGSAAFSNDDRRLFQELSLVFGKETQHQGFTDFRDISEQAQACAVGAIVDGHQVVVASFVGSRSQEGFLCSVRNFKNERIPGQPDFFPSVAQAISANYSYFLAMANSLRKMKKPWWKRVF